jgi:hypothetical protein
MLNPLTLLTGTNKNLVYALAGILAALILAAVVGWLAYGSGYDKADALGKAALATVQKQYSEASANATAEAYQKLERETNRADKIASQLVTTKDQLAKLKKDITGGIPHAVAHNDICTIGPDALRVLSASFYGVHPGTIPESSSTAGIATQPGEASSAGEGLRAGASVDDLLHWGRDMGVYVQELEAQRDGLRALLMEAE